MTVHKRYTATVGVNCDCEGCEITVRNDDGSTAETLTPGHQSTHTFETVGIEEVNGPCDTAEVHTVEAFRRFDIDRWDDD